MTKMEREHHLGVYVCLVAGIASIAAIAALWLLGDEQNGLCMYALRDNGRMRYQWDTVRFSFCFDPEPSISVVIRTHWLIFKLVILCRVIRLIVVWSMIKVYRVIMI